MHLIDKSLSALYNFFKLKAEKRKKEFIVRPESRKIRCDSCAKTLFPPVLEPFAKNFLFTKTSKPYRPHVTEELKAA